MRGVSGWQEKRPNGLPRAGRLPKSCHRMAAKGIEFPWRWGRGTISTNLDVIWGMSVGIFGLITATREEQEMTTKRIGIIGAGQAGQRIAVVLSKFDDVHVAGIVDPTANLVVLTNPQSPWHLKDTEFFIDDDEMLHHGEYDALVVAVDPLSVMVGDHRKMLLLARHNFSKPILWERPFGFKPEHPSQIVGALPTVPAHNIMSFTRFGIPPRILSPIIQAHQLGEIIDFEVLATLNCGLANKEWRHDP